MRPEGSVGTAALYFQHKSSSIAATIKNESTVKMSKGQVESVITELDNGKYETEINIGEYPVVFQKLQSALKKKVE